MLLGLESFSYYLAFSCGKMDVFSFIARAKELGLDGVQLNLEGEGWGHLGGDAPGHLARVLEACQERGLFIDLDACGTDPDYLLKCLDICQALGVDRLRTYSSFGGNVQEEMAKAIRDFKEVTPRFEEAGVGIAYENHEFETSHDVMRVIHETGSPVMGSHIDTGNSMMLWEDPVQAVRNMASKAVSTHFKDHLVIETPKGPVIIGVPLGSGSVDLAKCYAILADETGLERINIEVCWGYLAPFRAPPEQGQGAVLGTGAFRVAKPPFDPEVVAPHLLREKEGGFQSYAWQEIAGLASEDELDQLMAWQDQAVRRSVEHVKKLRAEHQKRQGIV
jgi:sugar phosphate isomerase/epimerase